MSHVPRNPAWAREATKTAERKRVERRGLGGRVSAWIERANGLLAEQAADKAAHPGDYR